MIGPRRSERKPDGSIGPKAPLPQMPRYHVVHLGVDHTIRAVSHRGAVLRFAKQLYNNPSDGVFPAEITAQKHNRVTIKTFTINKVPNPTFRVTEE